MEPLFGGRPIPRLGFGCMRLPETPDELYIVEECQAMFDFAMENGINYFDSAWHYIDSQKMIGICLAKYSRESYILVGKLCFYDGTLESREAAMEAFEQELTDARTDYMDLELIHALGNPGSIERVDALDIWGFMGELKASGRVKHVGISFHSWPENLDRILSEHPEIEVVQIQANYYDHNTERTRHIGASREVYDICRKHGKPIIIMEPIKGGSLAHMDRHPEIGAMFEAADPTRTPASWALRYAASLKGVVTVLSGMSSLEQMRQNYHTLMADYKPLSEDERAMLDEAGRILDRKAPVGCTGCKYCVDAGCPAGIDIPRILSALNTAEQYRDLPGARQAYHLATEVLHQTSPKDCVGCGNCERACPQKLAITRHLREAMALLASSVPAL